MLKPQKKIENIFHQIPGYNCFVCAPHHQMGFKAEFYHGDGDDFVYTQINPSESFVGFPGVLHGGFQGMLLDEIMFWAIFHFYQKITVTGGMEVKYMKTVPVNESFLVKGRVIQGRERIFKTEGWIEQNGIKLASAKGTFIVPKIEAFKRALGVAELPDIFVKML